LNGTTAAVGAMWMARVHQYCAMPLPTPFSASQSQSRPFGITKANGSVAPNATDSMMSWYTVSVSADSVVVMPRTPAVTVPNRIALASA
jgi:hypothetical protein